MNMRSWITVMLACVTLAGTAPAAAGPLRDRLEERRQQRAGGQEGEPATRSPGKGFALPPGVSIKRDVPYGPHDDQRMDVYLPAGARNAPVLFLVHGGGWRHGDKAHADFVQHKVGHWAPKGYVVVSVNYRMLPDADPVEQARDVARALAAAQRQAESWAADAGRFVLMGHSAGAHLVALLTADTGLAQREGVRPWLATVALDGAALDVVAVMQGKHLRLHDQAFGTDPAFWAKASPMHRLEVSAVAPRPMLLVCSSRRRESCPQAHALAGKARSLGAVATVLEEDLSHAEINQRLGLPGGYTERVDRFISSAIQ
nr:alpha/beta hydrolase [uncultured Caldimonas sp.]